MLQYTHVAKLRVMCKARVLFSKLHCFPDTVSSGQHRIEMCSRFPSDPESSKFAMHFQLKPAPEYRSNSVQGARLRHRSALLRS